MAWETIQPERVCSTSHIAAITLSASNTIYFNSGALKRLGCKTDEMKHVGFVYNSDTRSVYVYLTNEKDTNAFPFKGQQFVNTALAELLRKKYMLNGKDRHKLYLEERPVKFRESFAFMLSKSQ